MIMLGAVVFGTVGSVVPMMFGDIDEMIIWSILGGIIGGLFGIWAAYTAYNAIG